MQSPTDCSEDKACSTSVGSDSGSTCAEADGQGKTPAQVRVDLTPEVDRALQDQRLETAHGAGEIADQVGGRSAT